jgi:hypothetical protein
MKRARKLLMLLRGRRIVMYLFFIIKIMNRSLSRKCYRYYYYYFNKYILSLDCVFFTTKTSAATPEIDEKKKSQITMNT